MKIPAQDFAYTFNVPPDPRTPMHGTICDSGGSNVKGLMGADPVLRWIEYTPEPWKSFATVTVSTSQKRGAATKAVSFTLDRGLLSVLRASDVLHVCASQTLGISIVRDEHLIAAAGGADVLSTMPLGTDVRVHFPGWNLAERFFQQPDALHYFLGGPSPPNDHPFVEILAAGEARIMPWGRPEMGPYEVFLRPSVRPGNLCVSIERRHVCPETSAHRSAQLLDREGYQVVGSPSDEDETR